MSSNQVHDPLVFGAGYDVRGWIGTQRALDLLS